MSYMEKPTKIIVRVIAAPFVFMLLLLAGFVFALKSFFRYIAYGGEFLVYKYDDQKRIKDIYDILKAESEVQNG